MAPVIKENLVTLKSDINVIQKRVMVKVTKVNILMRIIIANEFNLIQK